MSGPPFFIDGPTGDEIAAAVALSKEWAQKVTDPPETVDGFDYSAKQQALWAAQSASEAAASAQAAADTLAAAEQAAVTVPYAMALGADDEPVAVGDTQFFFNLTEGKITAFHIGVDVPQPTGTPVAVELRVGATVVATLTLPNTQQQISAPVADYALAAGDIVKAVVTAAETGSGARALRAGIITVLA